MSEINPFVPAVAGTPMAQRQQVAEKSQQIRRAQIRTKSAIVPDDQFEHQVENSDRISATHDEEAGRQQRRKPQQHGQPGDEEEPHIDVTG